MAIELMPLDQSHCEEAAALLASAFREDRFVAGGALKNLDGDQRERCLRGFFSASASACVRRGIPWELRDEDQTVAVLLAYPPGGYPLPLLEQAVVFLKGL